MLGRRQWLFHWHGLSTFDIVPHPYLHHGDNIIIRAFALQRLVPSFHLPRRRYLEDGFPNFMYEIRILLHWCGQFPTVRHV